MIMKRWCPFTNQTHTSPSLPHLFTTPTGHAGYNSRTPKVTYMLNSRGNDVSRAKAAEHTIFRLWKHVEDTTKMETTMSKKKPPPVVAATSVTRMLPVKSHTSNRHNIIKPTSTWMVEFNGNEDKNTNVKEQSGLMFQSWEHMKLRGKVMNKDVMVLIDSGCTHNFINSNVVKALGLKPTALDPYVVHLPDGSNQLWNRQVKNVPLRMQTYYDLLTFGVMDLAHIDVILGQQWLFAKDPQISFRKHIVELDHNGKRHKLVGEKGLPDAAIVTGF